MITGYNTDVPHRDLVLHVQTEDKGQVAATIESLVYFGGQILGKRRTSYRSLLDRGESKQAIVDLMDQQHRLMIAEIRRGRYDETLVPSVAASVERAEERLETTLVAPPPQVEPSPPASEAQALTTISDSSEAQTLDQIILEYLESEAEQEHLILMMEVDEEFAAGRRAEIRFRTKGSLSGDPIAETRITLRMISTTSAPVTLGSGSTDGKGRLDVTLDIPTAEEGSCALIVTATSEIGSAEIKHLL